MTPFLAGLRYESRVARTVSCVETRRLQFCAVPEEADSRISNFLRSIRVPNAVLAATPSVRSMAPSKRRKTSAVSQPASGNASFGVRTRRSASTPGDLPDAPDADLDAEPEELMCPITRTIFRDQVFVFDSGHTCRPAPCGRTSAPVPGQRNIPRRRGIRHFERCFAICRRPHPPAAP